MNMVYRSKKIVTQKKNNRLLAVYLDLTVGTLEDSTLSNRNTSTMRTLGSVPFVYKLGMPVYRYHTVFTLFLVE